LLISNSVSDFHAHVHFWRLWSQLLWFFQPTLMGRLFIVCDLLRAGKMEDVEA